MSRAGKRARRRHLASPKRRGVFRTLAVGSVIVGVVLVVLSGFKKPSSTSEGQRGVGTAAGSLAKPLADERTVFGAYGGSESCRTCHEEQFGLWLKSNHGLAERSLQTGLDHAAFEPARTFLSGTQTTAVAWNGAAAAVTSIGLSGEAENHRVERVIGNYPLRQFLAGFPGGRFQAVEAAYDPRSNDWFNVYGNEDRQPGEWGHWTGRGMNWNSMCAGCHNTRVRKNYDQAKDEYHTTMAEVTVGCEACHGPLKAHNEWQKQFSKTGRKDPTVPKWSRERFMDACGLCHARRGDLTGDFKPGDSFLDHQRLTLVDASDTYYPDGQVREEDYEYAAFLGSRMHFRGIVCIDCHNPHSAKTILPGNWLCMKCHNGTYTNAPLIEPVSHSRHKVFGYDTNGILVNMDLMPYRAERVKETGGECVNCHMPQTAYMQRHLRRDHGFTIPDPLLTKLHGVPNACNRCHGDKDAEWALKYCEQWYGSKMERPTRKRSLVVASARKREPGAKEALIAMLATNDISYWRAVAAGLLGGWVEDASVRESLKRGLEDTNALVRSECAHSLGQLAISGVPGVTNALRNKLGDPVLAVRLAAAWGLRADLDRSSQAGIELVHALDINSDQPAGQAQLGAFALAREDLNRAAECYGRAVQWDANSGPIRHDYAVVLSRLDRSQEAVEQLQAACALEPRNAEFQYKLGLGWNELGQMGKTIECLQRAIQLAPDYAAAWYNLGLALNSTGRVEEALQSLIRAESADASDPRAPYARATILAKFGRLEEAQGAARRALEADAQFAPARQMLENLGSNLRHRGR